VFVGRRELITCYVRYTLNLDETDAFRQYAQLWIRLINRLGGTHHGYFVPRTKKGVRHLFAPALKSRH
jgi:hypothetical protein